MAISINESGNDAESGSFVGGSLIIAAWAVVSAALRSGLRLNTFEKGHSAWPKYSQDSSIRARCCVPDSPLDAVHRGARDPVLQEVEQLLAEGHVAVAIDLLRAVRATRRKGEGPGPACFRAVVQGLARFRSPHDLFDNLIEDMCHAGLPADRLTESCIVRYVCRGPNADLCSALVSYGAMVSSGVVPDLSTVECIAAACLRAKRSTAVEGLVAGLESFGLRPTAALYASLIMACGEDASAQGSALARMRAELAGDPVALNLGYASAVHVCARSRCALEAADLYIEARRAGVMLGAGPLAALLVAAVRADDEALALRVAAQARAEGRAAADSPVSRVVASLRTRPGSEPLAHRLGSALKSPTYFQLLYDGA